MHAAQKAHRLTTIEYQITAFNPTWQVLTGDSILERLACMVAGHFGNFRANKAPAIVRWVRVVPLKHYDIAQEVFEIAGGQVGSRGHRACAGFAFPKRQKLQIKRVTERERGVAKVMPLFPGSSLVKRSGGGDNVHVSIFDRKS